jgi:multidrug efflux pump
VRVWFGTIAEWAVEVVRARSLGHGSRVARDRALAREAARVQAPEIIWDTGPLAEDDDQLPLRLPPIVRAAE